MKKCVILTMDNCDGFEVYDYLLEEPLARAGWECETISWRAQNVDWNDYQVVMIRSPWDYQLYPQEFLTTLQKIDSSKALLENPLQIVRWNINKKYLQDLENKNTDIVPTLWSQNLSVEQLELFFSRLNTDEIVIKPTVGAGSIDTFRINKNNIEQSVEEVIKAFREKEFMVQPFMTSVIKEGEYSVFYFDGEFSHAILKSPKQNDFRVQEEYGGQLSKVEPEKLLTDAAEKVLNAIDQSLLYTRLDFIRNGNHFALIEAELIEPSLYFNLDPLSPQRYVDALERRAKRLGIIE